MLGAIIGDTVGSIYEFDNIKTTDFPLFSERSEFTDDSVMCFAVADWLLRDEHHTHKELEASMVRFAHEYPNPLGGDSDTLACITGGIAEAYYKEIPEEIVKEMWSRLPETFREILREMERNWGYPLKGNVG